MIMVNCETQGSGLQSAAVCKRHEVPEFGQMERTPSPATCLTTGRISIGLMVIFAVLRGKRNVGMGFV